MLNAGRFTFAMADEFVAKIRATAQFYRPMKKVLADLDVNIEQVQDTPTVGRWIIQDHPRACKNILG